MCVYFLFLHKPSVFLHSVCSQTFPSSHDLDLYCLLGPINLDLRYFVAKSVCHNLRVLRCKFYSPKKMTNIRYVAGMVGSEWGNRGGRRWSTQDEGILRSVLIICIYHPIYKENYTFGHT